MEDSTKNQPIQANEEELTSDYANNAYFVATIWDLKILFGELTATNHGIDWHTSITLPWAQAKLMAYFLDINIAAHELNNGPIRVPQSALPPVPPPILDADKDNPAVHALVKFITERRNKFLESLK